MTLRPADLLGLPEGFPDPLVHLVAFRYLLFALALGWAWVVLRARQAWWTAAGVVWVVVAIGFWVLSFGRPYGVLADRDTTLRAARIAVVGEAGGVAEGVLSGEGVEPTLWTTLAARRVSPRALQMLPTFLPLATLPLLGLAVHLLWRRREIAACAALLWLAFATGELETVRGLGLAGGLWSRPEVALALPLLVALGLLLARLRGSDRLWPLSAVLLAILAAALPGSLPRLGFADTLLVLTFDQGAWLFLGAYGLLRRPDPAARALTCAGAVLLLAQAVSASADAFTGQALYRLGLLLGAAPVVADLCERAGTWMAGRVRSLDPSSAGAAALVALLVPGSFLAWWDPTMIDGVAGASVPELTSAIYQVTDWLRDETEAAAVVLASEDYAPTVAVLAGRRLLRAPTLSQPADEWRRIRAQAAVLEGRDPQKYVARYGVTYVLIAPSEFVEHGLARPEDLDALRQLRLRYTHPEGYRVYQIVR